MNKNKKKTTIIFVSFIILIAIFLHNLKIFSFFENSVKEFITPVTSFFYKKNYSADLEKLSELSKNELLEKIKQLEIEMKNNEIYESQNKILLDENEELKNQLNFVLDNDYKTVGAEVVGRSVDPLGTTLIINRGENDDIDLGDPVIIGNGILVGKIIKINEKDAIVRLINDNNSKIGATILNMDKSLGLVEGGYSLGVKMDYIPQNEILNIGDIIVSSGLSDGVPRGLLIGKIEVVEKEPHKPFQQAILKTSADLSYITVVSVITKI